MSVPDPIAAGWPSGRSGSEQPALIDVPSAGRASPERGSSDSATPGGGLPDSRFPERGSSEQGRQVGGAERRVTIHWPDGRRSQELCGRDWLAAARAAGQSIPIGCLGGSCGACEIEVNGQVVRACIAQVPPSRQGVLRVELASDPYW